MLRVCSINTVRATKPPPPAQVSSQISIRPKEHHQPVSRSRMDGQERASHKRSIYTCDTASLLFRNDDDTITYMQILLYITVYHHYFGRFPPADTNISCAGRYCYSNISPIYPPHHLVPYTPNSYSVGYDFRHARLWRPRRCAACPEAC